MSLDITNGINGRINTLYWSKYATVINPIYQTDTCRGVYEMGTIMAFKSPEGSEMGSGVVKNIPLFTTKSGKTIFLRYFDEAPFGFARYVTNLDTGEAVNYDPYAVYCFNIDLCIGTYESYSVVQQIQRSPEGSVNPHTLYDNLSSVGYERAGDLTGHFQHVLVDLDYGAAYTSWVGKRPFYTESNYHGVIACNDEDNSKVDFYILAYPGSFVSGGYYGEPIHMSCDDPMIALSPDFSIPYSILEQYLTEEDTDVTPPGFEADVTKPGGGNNTPSYNNYPGDDVGFPELPTTSLLTSGMYGFYNPNAAGFTLLADWLWSDTFLDAAKRAFVNQPLDAIIFAGMLPFNLTTTPSTIEAAGLDSNIPAGKITKQYYILDFGYVNVPEKWRSVMDYKFTKTSIYLPYVGVRNIDHEVIMDATLRLKYMVDAITGDFVAMITVTKKGYNESVYYTFNGNMLITLPLTGNDRTAMISATMSAVGGAISNIGGGAIAGSAFGPVGTAFGGAAGAARTLGSVVSSANNFTKQDIKQTGSFNSSAGALSGFEAYVIVEQPVQSMPAHYGHHIGFTSNMTFVLGNLTGFTVIDEMHLNIQASDDELNEIYTKLKDGVIL